MNIRLSITLAEFERKSQKLYIRMKINKFADKTPNSIIILFNFPYEMNLFENNKNHTKRIYLL